MQWKLLPKDHLSIRAITSNLTSLGLEMMRAGDTDAMRRIQTRAEEIRNTSRN